MLWALLPSAMVASTLGASGIADAKDRRLNGGTCEAGDDETDRWNSGLYQNFDGNDQDVYCNIPNDSYFRQSEAVDLRVGAHKPNTNAAMYARACIQFYNGSGSACGAATHFGAGTSPSQSISDLSQWAFFWHGGYVSFRLPDNAYIFNMYWHD